MPSVLALRDLRTALSSHTTNTVAAAAISPSTISAWLWGPRTCTFGRLRPLQSCTTMFINCCNLGYWDTHRHCWYQNWWSPSYTFEFSYNQIQSKYLTPYIPNLNKNIFLWKLLHKTGKNNYYTTYACISIGTPEAWSMLPPKENSLFN